MGQCGSGPVQTKESAEIDRQLRSLAPVLKNEIKLLLLGTGESGKSTVFKQMKILQDKGGFTEQEVIGFRNIARGNCIAQMRTLVQACNKFGYQYGSEQSLQCAQYATTLEGYSDWTPQVGQVLMTLWRDPAIRKAYGQQGGAFQLDESASYLFDGLARISADNYMPTNADILRCRTRTTGVDEAIFVFEHTEFRVIDVGGQRSERRKWLSTFDCVTAVIFCIAISDYDQVLREDRTQNRMKEALVLFEEIVNSQVFHKIDFIVFFNKIDLFAEKLSRSSPAVCFPNFPAIREPEAARQWIAQRFLEVKNPAAPHKVYHHFTCAIDPENMGLIFANVRTTLLNDILRQMNMGEF